MRCLALFNNQGGQLTPIQVQAPGGGNNPEFNAMFADLPDPRKDAGSGGGITSLPLHQRDEPPAEPRGTPQPNPAPQPGRSG